MLLKQDKTEAVMAVDGRLEFIDKEMWASTSEFLSWNLTSLQKEDRKADQGCPGEEWPVEIRGKLTTLRAIIIDKHGIRSYKYSLKPNHRLQKLKQCRNLGFDG